MKRAWIAMTLLGLAQAAQAEPHKVLVLQSEGRTEGETRSKIDAAIIKLASSGNAQVSPGDITFTDAAAAVGCKPSVATCRDEVLEMLGVDEVVYATITPKPGGTEVHVHRVTNGGMTRDAKMLIATGEPVDKLDGIAPLFVTAKPEKPVEPLAKPADPPPAKPAPKTTAMTTTTTRPTEPVLAPVEPAPPAEPEPAPTTEPTAAPLGPTDYVWSERRKKMEITGMIGGGTLVMFGFILWGKASSIQDQVDGAPIATRPQLEELAALESRGDSYAAWGNVMFLGGAVLGGISTYYFLKDRKRSRASSSARITPAVFDHGAGISFTGVMP